MAGCSTKADNDVNVSNYFHEKKEETLSKKFDHPCKPPRELKLTSILYQLAIAPDPEKFAKKHNIYFSKGRMRVYIFFNPDPPISEREEIIQKYNIMVEKKAENLSRAMVPVNQLIPLSKEPVIGFIKLPDVHIEPRRESHE